MKKGLKIVLLVILVLVAVPLLIVTLSDKFGADFKTPNDLPKYTSEEIYNGIKNSFDNNVIPAMEEGMEIITEGLQDPEKVFDEFIK